MAIPCRRLFAGRPMPDLEIQMPVRQAPARVGIPVIFHKDPV